MNTVLMAVAIVKDGSKLLLRKMDPAKSPYMQLWAVFGGRIEESGEGIVASLNKELSERWNFSVSLQEKLWWDEEIKIDHDGQEKRFIYLDALCSVDNGTPEPVNKNEILEWVDVDSLQTYDINPPTEVLLKRLGYLGHTQ